MMPMIDVVFLLLVFFLWTSSFDPPEFDLPGNVSMAPPATNAQSGRTATVPPEAEAFDEIVVRVGPSSPTPTLRFNDDPVADVASLRTRIADVVALGVQPPVIVHPSDATDVSDAVAVFDAIRDAGAVRVFFAARPEVR